MDLSYNDKQKEKRRLDIPLKEKSDGKDEFYLESNNL